MDLSHLNAYHVAVGHQLLLGPGNNVAKVYVVRYDVIHPYSFPRGEAQPVEHRPNMWVTTMAPIEVPIHELWNIHQIPLYSTTSAQLQHVMEQLGIPWHVASDIVRLLKFESTLVRAETLLSSSGQIVFTVSVIFHTFLRVNDSGHEEEEQAAEEVADNEALPEEVLREASTLVSPETAAAEDYLESFVVDKGTSEEICPVCLDDIESGNQAARMPCTHVYHETCITKWLKVSPTCPICRYQLPL